MGLGDALMATAEAKALHQRTGVKVAIGDGSALKWGAPEHQVFAGNGRLATDSDIANGVRVQWLRNYSGNRPYIDRARMEREFAHRYPGKPFTLKAREAALPWRWSDWSVSDIGSGELFLTDAERQRAEAAGSPGYIVIEPLTKSAASPNKQWPWDRFERVADVLGRDAPILQIGPSGVRRLRNARHFETLSFREGCAVLERASLFIGGEGGLHHAAAALGIPAVVIFGGYIAPKTTGYAGHRNLFAGGQACGQRVPCEHCRKAMDEISADDVIGAARSLL